MIRVYPSESRHTFDHGWLRGGHSFSFGDYHDPDNMAFGPMRVCNDDVIAPGRGFGAHPHSDMEIVSIVLSGELRHEDNLGNVATSSFGGIQRMSAGTGIIHSEHNASTDEEVHLLQLWFMPEERGSIPSYTTSKYDPSELDGALLQVVSQYGDDNVADIGQDITIYLSRLEEGDSIPFRQKEGRRVFLFVIEGGLIVNETTELGKRDSARVENTPKLDMVAVEDSFFMLIDLP